MTKKTLGILGVALVFIAGAAAGWLAAHAGYRKKMDQVLKGEPEVFHELIVKRLDRKLGLDSGQRQQLRVILKETNDEVAEAKEDLNPEIQEILREAKSKVRNILRSDQARKFEQMTAVHDFLKPLGGAEHSGAVMPTNLPPAPATAEK